MNLNFRTEINYYIEVSSTKPQDFDYESRLGKMHINSIVDIEVREWGIKNLTFWAPDQSVEISVEVIHKDKEDYEDIKLKLNLHDLKVVQPKDLSGNVCPKNLELKIETLEKQEDGIFTGQATGTLEFSGD